MLRRTLLGILLAFYGSAALAQYAPAKPSQPDANPIAKLTRPAALDGSTFILGPNRIVLDGIVAVRVYSTCETASGGRDECGKRAMSFIAEPLDAGSVTCTSRGVVSSPVVGEQEVVLATCSAPGFGDLASMIVNRGYAVPDSPFSPYREAALDACARRVGLWAGAWLDPRIERRRRLGEDIAPRWIGARTKLGCLAAITP